MAVGQTLTIDTGLNREIVTISAVGTAGAAGTGVTFSPALASAHASGARVVASVDEPLLTDIVNFRYGQVCDKPVAGQPVQHRDLGDGRGRGDGRAAGPDHDDDRHPQRGHAVVTSVAAGTPVHDFVDRGVAGRAACADGQGRGAVVHQRQLHRQPFRPTRPGDAGRGPEQREHGRCDRLRADADDGRVVLVPGELPRRREQPEPVRDVSDGAVRAAERGRRVHPDHAAERDQPGRARTTR